MSKRTKKRQFSPPIAPKAYAGEVKPSAVSPLPYRPLPVRLPPVDKTLCRAVAQAQRELRKYESRIYKQETVASRKDGSDHKSGRLRHGVRSKGRGYFISGVSNGLQDVQQPHFRPRISNRDKMRLSGLLSLLQTDRVSGLLSRVCSSRKARRRALFRLQRVGHGTAGHRVPRWSASSYVRCK